MAEVVMVALNADPSDDRAAFRTPSLRCLWDIRTHYTMISEDVLPTAFIDRTREQEYTTTYGSQNNLAIKADVSIQFSNCRDIQNNLHHSSARDTAKWILGFNSR